MQHDWQTLISTPWEARKFVMPLQDYIGKFAIVAIIPVQSIDQAKELLTQNETSILPAEKESVISVSREMLAEDLGLTVGHVNVLSRTGIIVKTDYGDYDYRKSVKNYIVDVRRQMQGRGTMAYQEERAKRLAVQREGEEIKLAEKKMTLVSADALEKELAGWVLMIKNKLLSASTRADNPDVQEGIDAVAREILTDLGRFDGREIVTQARKQVISPGRPTKDKSVGRKGKSLKPKNKRRAGKVAK